MAASYPGSIVALSTKNDGDTIFASHVDALQDETIAVETALLNGFQHNLIPLNDNSKDLGDAAHAWKNLWTKGTTQFNGISYTWPATDTVSNAVLGTNGSHGLTWTGLQALSNPSTTGNITALPLPAGLVNLYIFMANATLTTIQGIAAGVAGQHLTIFSTGAGQVDFTYNDAAAAAGNKVLTFATVGKTSLAPGVGVAEFVYDIGGRWIMVGHKQGDYIAWTPTFTTNTGATWTAVVVTSSKYLLDNRRLHLIFEYSLSTVSAPTLELRFTLPVLHTTAIRSFAVMRLIDNGAAAAVGSVLANTTDQFCRLYKDLTDAANWAASATNTSARGAIDINVN